MPENQPKRKKVGSGKSSVAHAYIAYKLHGQEKVAKKQ